MGSLHDEFEFLKTTFRENGCSIIEIRRPCLRLLYQSMTCLPRPLDIDVVGDTAFFSPPISFLLIGSYV